jgi:hypothetical protein
MKVRCSFSDRSLSFLGGSLQQSRAIGFAMLLLGLTPAYVRSNTKPLLVSTISYRLAIHHVATLKVVSGHNYQIPDVDQHAPPPPEAILTQKIGENKDESLEDPSVIKRRHFVRGLVFEQDFALEDPFGSHSCL